MTVNPMQMYPHPIGPPRPPLDRMIADAARRRQQKPKRKRKSTTAPVRIRQR